MNLQITNGCRANRLLIFVVCILPLIWILGLQNLFQVMIKEFHYEKIQLKLKIQNNFDIKAPIFVSIICQGDKVKKAHNLKESLKRQIEQATTLIKSAAVLSTSKIHFIIVVDSDSIFDTIVEIVNVWPENIRNKFSLEMRTVWYPKGREGNILKTLFRLCVTERLFIAEHLTDIDSVIYTDTDTLFLRPPEELWKEFQYFDSVQMCAMTETEFYYKPSHNVPYYGTQGLNAGVWMMNLTRMRNYPGGWDKTCQATFEKYKENITLADQDIANIIFNKTPEYLYKIPCRWNFRSQSCQRRNVICKEVKEKGTFLLHGCSMKFYDNRDLKMKTMYDVWKGFNPGRSLTDLLTSFKKELKKVRNNGSSSIRFCSKVKSIDQYFTKGLEAHLRTFNED